MRDDSIVVARPTQPRELILLFHGVGSSAADLVPIGEAIAKARPWAVVVSVDAPHASSLGRGREWFSVIGVTEQNRPGRIGAAMPSFVDAVTRWQESSGVGAAQTVLIGFSQGAIMALESTQVESASTHAGCVIAIAGRFAVPPRHGPRSVRFHFIHGDQDGVVPTRFSVEGALQLRSLGVEASVDVLPGLGHGIDARALQLLLERLGASAP